MSKQAMHSSGINQPQQNIEPSRGRVCPGPTATFVDLEEIRAFTPRRRNAMFYEESSIAGPEVVESRRGYHNPLFMAQTKLILERDVSNLGLDHK